MQNHKFSPSKSQVFLFTPSSHSIRIAAIIVQHNFNRNLNRAIFLSKWQQHCIEKAIKLWLLQIKILPLHTQKQNRIYCGVQRSPVALLVWDQAAAGSNPVAPTCQRLCFATGCSAARQRSWFGTRRPQVRILSPRQSEVVLQKLLRFFHIGNDTYWRIIKNTI